MTEIRDRLALEALSLGLGESRRLRCPFCNSQKEDLSLSHNERGMFYHCFSPACGKNGRLAGPSGLSTALVPEKPPLPWWMENLSPERIPADVSNYLEQKYHISMAALYRNGVLWDVDLLRLVIPLKWEGATIGLVARDLSGKAKNKVLSHFYGDTHLALFAPDHTQVPVVVEDVLSALRLAGEGITTISLNGSSISESDGTKVAGKYPAIILALDNDPAGVCGAIKIKHTYGSLFASIKTIQLSKDIKDLDPNDFEELVSLIHELIT